ncbi:MAG: PorT family protein [bacterium]|nr:PorT family protein [bacterium]
MNPRKAIIPVAIALAVLAAAGPLQAQVPFVPRAEFGVKAGINLSDINTDQLGSSTRSGFVGGVYLDLATALLHLQAEALLTQRGFKDGTPLGSYPGSSVLEFRNTLLQVPVLLVFALPVPVVSPRIYAGPAFNIPLKSEVKLDSDWADIKSDTRNTWSLVMGVGVKVTKIGVDLRYDIGLTAFNDRPVGEVLDDALDEVNGADQYEDIKQRTFSVTVSLALN